MTVLSHLDALERALTLRGWPALAPWWRSTLTEFYESGRRQLVLRVGRRGGKSSTLCRIAVLEALFGEHAIPPGDVGIVGIVSVSRDEAAQRLRTVKAILDAVSVAYSPIEGGIELQHKPIAFKTFAATVSAVVGGTWVCGIADEVARWRDADTGSNPASRVLASLRPTMATQPHARLFLSSSPLGTQDAHADAFAIGDNAWQGVAYAPTWIANPTLTEQETHRLEPDLETWRREYQAVPIEGSELSLFADSVLLQCTWRGPTPERQGPRVAAMDPGTRSNAWAVAVAEEVEGDDGARLVRVVAVRQWRGSRSAPLDPSATLGEIAAWLREHGIREVWSDQFAGDFIVSMAREHDLEVHIEPSTAASKVATYEGLRQRFADGSAEIPDDAQVRADLLGVRKWVTRNGISIELARTPDGRHSDHASAIALAVSKAASNEAGWMSAMRKKRKREERVEADDWRVQIREVRRGQHVLENPFRNSDCAVFAEDGRSIAYFNSGASDLWRKAVSEYMNRRRST